MLTKALPSIRLRIDGVSRNVLIDTGCTKCVAHVSSCKRWTRQPVALLAVNGKELECQGMGVVGLERPDGGRATVEAIVADAKPLGFDFILGMNGIEALGGVFVSKGPGVSFGSESAQFCSAVRSGVVPVRLEERDFTVAFDPAKPVRTVAWKWTGGEGSALLKNSVKEYPPSLRIQASYEAEVEKWEHGTLEIPRVWQRVAIDITHCGARPVLTLTDCGPSRFAVWQPLRLQASAGVIEQLENVFCERRAPEKLLLDNDTAFQSRQFTAFTARWRVRLRFRCAYVPSGNGTAERCHRSVKVMAARKGCSIPEAVYLYNVTTRDDCSASSTPAAAMYRYDVRVREVDQLPTEDQPGDAPYVVGKKVWVKPPGARCVSRYHQGKVTAVLSRHAVEVDGTPRHVRDLRHRMAPEESHEQAPPEDDPDDELALHFTPPEARSMPVDKEQLATTTNEEPVIRELDSPSVGLRRSSRLRWARCSGT